MGHEVLASRPLPAGLVVRLAFGVLPRLRQAAASPRGLRTPRVSRVPLEAQRTMARGDGGWRGRLVPVAKTEVRPRPRSPMVERPWAVEKSASHRPGSTPDRESSSVAACSSMSACTRSVDRVAHSPPSLVDRKAEAPVIAQSSVRSKRRTPQGAKGLRMRHSAQRTGSTYCIFPEVRSTSCRGGD
jgi:hypothetical protein